MVQTLSGGPQYGPSFVGDAQTSAGRRLVTVTYQLAASLSDLAEGRTPNRLELKAGSKGFFESPSAEEASRHHVLYGARIVQVNNGFPVAFHLLADTFTGVDVSCKSAVDCGDGQTCVMGDHLIQASESATYGDKGVPFLRGNGDRIDATQFAKEFPTYNETNLEKGIKVLDGTGDMQSALVEHGHPATRYFNAVRQAQGVAPLGPADLVPGTSYYVAKNEDVQRCIARLREQLRGSTANLYKFGFTIKRVFGDVAAGANTPAFDDEKELHTKFASASSLAGAKSKVRQLTVSVMYDFRPS